MKEDRVNSLPNGRDGS